MAREIAPTTLAHLLDTGSTLALIDVREHGEYNLAHIPGASSVPRRQLEARAGRLIPPVDSVYPLEQGRAAFERLASGEQFGKVVIKVS